MHVSLQPEFGRMRPYSYARTHPIHRFCCTTMHARVCRDLGPPASMLLHQISTTKNWRE